MRTVWAKNKLNEFNTRLFFQIKLKRAEKIILIASDFYRLFVNGEFMGYGPAKAAENYARTDEYRLSEYRDFVITVEVLCYNIPSYSVASGHPMFGAEIIENGKVVASTGDFACYEVDDYVRKTQKYSFQRGFSEKYRMVKDRGDFYNGKSELKRLEVSDVACPVLLDRGVPYPDYKKITPEKAENGVVRIDENAKLWYESWQMENNEKLNVCFDRSEIEEFVSDTVSKFVYEKGKDAGNTLTENTYAAYDFGKINTGFFESALCAEQESHVYLIWSETASLTDDGIKIDFSRNDCCDIIKYELKRGEYKLLTMEPYCARFALLVCAKGKITVKDFALRRFENIKADRLSFVCENKRLEEIVKASQNTLAQNAVDIFTDCPGRERAGWLCDSYFMGEAEKLMFGDNAVEKNFLENYILAEGFSGYPENVIPMCYPSHILSGKFIPNWMLWFILELRGFLERSGNVALVRKAKRRVYGILEYFKKYENADGLLENLSSWVFIEWSKANDFTEGVNFPTNMLYAVALSAAGELYNDGELIKKAGLVKEKICDLSFNGKFFEDNAVRDESGALVKTGNVTETCQYYAIYFGFAEDERFSGLKKTMIDNFGINRTENPLYSQIYKSNCFIGNYLRLAFLLKAQKYDKLLDECESLFTGMAKATGTLWEHDCKAKSLNHGYASYAACLIIEGLRKSGKYKFEITYKSSDELYGVAAERVFDPAAELKQGKSTVAVLDVDVDEKRNYILNVVGEVNFDYTRRFERILPIYYRKLDDSVKTAGGKRVLFFNKENEVKERSCYTMITEGLEKGEYEFSVKAAISGLKKRFSVTAEIYYGDKKTRYYYERPDKTILLSLKNSTEYKVYRAKVKLSRPADFVMIKISATDFDGEAKLFAPEFRNVENVSLCPDFDVLPDDLADFKWIGEGFSLVERPKYSIKINDREIFRGRIMDRLQRFAGFKLPVPENVIKNGENKIEIFYDENNIKSYSIKKVRLLNAPKGFCVLGVKNVIRAGEEFGVFVYSEGEPTSVGNEYVDFLGFSRADEKYGVMKFKAKKPAVNVSVDAESNGAKESVNIKSIIDKKGDDVITGTGDFIYVNQNVDEFAEYLSWYLKNGIGEYLTFRCVYHWGGADELNERFWKTAVKLLRDLKIYYALMYDGRELNGINASPSNKLIKSEYYLGSQTHERDGAYIYWEQDLSRIDAFYYNVLSRKIKHSGMYGKTSPVYDKNKTAKMFYAPDDAKDLKEAYEKFCENLRKTSLDGATRHTGVTTLFKTFYEVGYEWVGYESMYGPHELMLGALRGAARAYGRKNYGTHLALQWSTVPTNDERHFLRYKLSLYLSYMHGASEINTEEGLWRIENPFADFDNFSYACEGHRKVQSDFNEFIKRHARRGKLKSRIAMISGKYDGMEGFSSPYVFGQKGWAYSSPEKSWEVLKVFYPECDINAIYYYITKGGKNNVPLKDRQLMEVRKGLYRDVIDYRQVGFYSDTPYGVIDIIPSESKTLGEYEFLFFAGWNTADEAEIKRLCEFVEKGGTLMLAKPHLYATANREEALSGKAEVLKSASVSRLLSYADKGRVIYFDRDAYPADYSDEYRAKLLNAAEKHSNRYIKNTKRLSYTEFETENGTTVFYLLNIDWWDNAPAEYDFVFNGKTYSEKISGNDLRILTINGETAAFTEDLKTDVERIENGKIYLSGFGLTKVTVYAAGERTEKRFFVYGEKTI